MRTEFPLNYDWLYSNTFLEEHHKQDCQETEFERVMIPHTNIELPFHYFDEKDYQIVSSYRKHFQLQESWKHKRIAIHFGAVSSYAVVYVNGQWVGEHKGGYTAFSFDITDVVSFEEDNVVSVMVDSREREEIPPFGKVIDYLVYGGIYREVSLEVTNYAYIKDVFVKTNRVLEAKKEILLQLEMSMVHENSAIQYVVYDQQQVPVYESKAHRVDHTLFELSDVVSGLALWDLEHPVLYALKVQYLVNGNLVDEKQVEFGLRLCEFKVDGFYLNGTKIKLMGLNRHQSYPYVGYAMPKSGQIKDADICKFDLGLNLVRTSHYPQSQHFIDRCDEIGLLVFTEIPGWQHIGEEGEWWDITCQHVQEMVVQYRNHPSIILWGVRINESPDCDGLYQRTNDLCRSLDSTRQTGGVRCIQKSNLLEDVYTYNDFIHRGNNAPLDHVAKAFQGEQAPYLVCEYNGHMFPTKRFDHEARRLEHAHRHLRVIHAMQMDPHISGSIGWCMNDYNTHQDFGSGDRICYHGVQDMFRQPKLAAFVYASQQDKRLVMELSSTMNIGEHDACEIGDVVVFTNVDSINLYKNDEFIKTFYPNKKDYPGLSHPPILIDDMIGEQIALHEQYPPKLASAIKELALAIGKYGQNTLPSSYLLQLEHLSFQYGIAMSEVIAMYSKYVGNWGGKVIVYRFDGIKEGQVVKSIHKSPVMSISARVKVDTTLLIEEDTYDMTRIVIDAVDQHDNLVPYYQEPIQVHVEGDLALIGSNLLSFIGGSCGMYVKSVGSSGKGNLILESERLGRHVVEFIIEKQ